MSRFTDCWDYWHELVILVALVIAFVTFLCIGFSKTYSCPDCGHINHPSANYCEKCGRQLRV